MRKEIWAILLFFSAFLLESCEEKCSEDICPGSAVNFEFRYLDSAGNDLVFGPDSIRRFHEDSVFMIAQNEHAISFFPVTVNSVRTSDTTGVLRGSLSAKHNRYIITAMDSALVLADTLTPDSLLIDSMYVKKFVTTSDTLIAGFITYDTECCINIIDRFDLTIDSTVLCTECDENRIHILYKDPESL